jgi:hypothetical protein
MLLFDNGCLALLPHTAHGQVCWGEQPPCVINQLHCLEPHEHEDPPIEQCNILCTMLYTISSGLFHQFARIIFVIGVFGLDFCACHSLRGQLMDLGFCPKRIHFLGLFKLVRLDELAFLELDYRKCAFRGQFGQRDLGNQARRRCARLRHKDSSEKRHTRRTVGNLIAANSLQMNYVHLHCLLLYQKDPSEPKSKRLHCLPLNLSKCHPPCHKCAILALIAGVNQSALLIHLPSLPIRSIFTSPK